MPQEKVAGSEFRGLRMKLAQISQAAKSFNVICFRSLCYFEFLQTPKDWSTRRLTKPQYQRIMLNQERDLHSRRMGTTSQASVSNLVQDNPTS